MAGRSARAIGVVATAAIGFAAAAGAVEVSGTEATVGWAAASGPVTGYYVIVSRDDGPAEVEAVTVAAQETLGGTAGETLVVQVAAFGADGVAGPVSPPSAPITFVSGGSSSGGGSGDGSGDGSAGGSTGDGSGDGSSGGSGAPAPVMAVARDFDGDGLSDLVLQSGPEVRVWAMQGAHVGTELLLPQAPDGARLVGTGDYDGNRTADLLWEQPSSGTLTLWLLDGGVVVATGTLDRGLPSGEDWNVGGSGDADGDGRDDVVLFSRSTGDAEIWHLDGVSVAGRTAIAGRSGAWSLSVDDTDGDGLAELIWLDELGGTLELQDPQAAGPVALGEVSEGWRQRGAVDLDGDGGGELLMHHAASGAAQRWVVDDAGVLASGDLPSTVGLGALASTGDYDGDGLEDVAWSQTADGVVTLWLAGGAQALEVDRSLPDGYQIAGVAEEGDGASSEPASCTGDIDGDGALTKDDFQLLKACMRGNGGASCDAADLSGDGIVDRTDFELFKSEYTGGTCGS